MKPTIYVFVGLPGSGKSTYAAELSEREEVVTLSSDSIRKELFGSEETQDKPWEVFALMEQRAIEALSEGRSVIYDATSLTKRDRAKLLKKLDGIDCLKVAVVIAADKQACIDRDASRSRTVGADVIEKLSQRLEFPVQSEGFDRIQIILKK